MRRLFSSFAAIALGVGATVLITLGVVASGSGVPLRPSRAVFTGGAVTMQGPLRAVRRRRIFLRGQVSRPHVPGGWQARLERRRGRYWIFSGGSAVDRDGTFRIHHYFPGGKQSYRARVISRRGRTVALSAAIIVHER